MVARFNWNDKSVQKELNDNAERFFSPHGEWKNRPTAHLYQMLSEDQGADKFWMRSAKTMLTGATVVKDPEAMGMIFYQAFAAMVGQKIVEAFRKEDDPEEVQLGLALALFHTSDIRAISDKYLDRARAEIGGAK